MATSGEEMALDIWCRWWEDCGENGGEYAEVSVWVRAGAVYGGLAGEGGEGRGEVRAFVVL